MPLSQADLAQLIRQQPGLMQGMMQRMVPQQFNPNPLGEAITMDQMGGVMPDMQAMQDFRMLGGQFQPNQRDLLENMLGRTAGQAMMGPGFVPPERAVVNQRAASNAAQGSNVGALEALTPFGDVSQAMFDANMLGQRRQRRGQ